MNSLIKILLIAVFLNALSWIVLIPVWQYPDEQAHFAQLQNMVEVGKKPTGKNDTSYEIAISENILGTERDGLGNNKFTYNPDFQVKYSNNFYGPFENLINNLNKELRTKLVKDEATYNPPLYYFLGSNVYKIFYDSNLFSRVYSIRIYSSLLFLITIYLSFQIGKLLFKDNKYLPITLAALVAFQPMHVFSSTGILPDPLTNMLFSVVLLLSILIIKDGFRLITIIILALTVFLGVLTRQQFLISLTVIFYAIIYRIVKEPKYIKTSLIIGALIGLFLIFSSTLGTGLPIITNFRVAELSSLGFSSISSSSLYEFIKWSIVKDYAQVWPWYWGNYKWLSLTVPPLYYQVINRLVIIAIIGLLIRVFFIIKSKKITQQSHYLGLLLFSSLMYLVILTIWDYLFKIKAGYSFGIQGRYFFPLIIANFAVLLIGFRQIFRILFKKYVYAGIVVLVLLMITFNNLSLLYIAGSYYDVSSINTFIIQASQYKPALIKGNIIMVIIGSALVSQAIFIFYFLKHVITSTKN